MNELSPELAKKRVLIVDDAGSMRGLFKAILRSFGIENILEAADGSEALKSLQLKPVDIIFCDWEMPKKDGLQLFDELKNNEEYKHIPFVLVTSMAEVSKVKIAIDKGIKDYIVKPFKPDTIFNKINDIFNADIE